MQKVDIEGRLYKIMIANSINLHKTYETFGYNHNQIIKENFEKFKEFYRRFINKIDLNFIAFWKENCDRILKIFENRIEYEEDAFEVIKRYFKEKINKSFSKYVDFSEEFLELIQNDYYYQQYFNWFKRYYLYFFSKFIKYTSVKCLIEKDIEVPSESYIKIVITLPFEDENYKFMLDLMSIFIKQQELLMENLILNFDHQIELFRSFKKTFFIFKSIDE